MSNHRLGIQLKKGDVIKVWWRPGHDTIVDLEPYTGAYKNDPGWENCRVATFIMLPSRKMTVFAGEDFELAEHGS